MKRRIRNSKRFMIRRFLLALFIYLLSGLINNSIAQEIRWLRVGELQSPINEILAEYEVEFNQTGTTSNYFSWPAQYHVDQTCTRMKGLWIGCTNFNDPVTGTVKSIKVIGSGPKFIADPFQIFPQEIKLVGKFQHPAVLVDGATSTDLEDYDILDEEDPDLPCDRMVVVKANTSVGISVTKKVMAFANSEHGNYFINDYVFKNTGIINQQGEVQQQTLENVWFYWHFRYAFAGVSVGGNGTASLWGAFPSLWGNSNITHSFGEDPANPEFLDYDGENMRGFFTWYGPSNDAVRTPAGYDGDWGCPKLDEPNGGTLGSAKFAGVVTLHADTGPQDQNDNISQPKTTWYISPDINEVSSTSQYDDNAMAARWSIITEGHPSAVQKHDILVEGIYPITWTDPRRQTGGGVAQGQGFGPYNLAPGDSIHIVFAEGVSGLSWEKGREVGGNWLKWFNGTGNPTLIMPNGSTTTDYNEYKRSWVVDAGRDSVLETYRKAIQNYKSSYNLPQPPPPPAQFSVSGGGDRIRLEWAAVPSSNGYVIYRSGGTVLDWRTVYEKIFETDEPSVTSFDDVTASRGLNYFYYIQSKDDGTQVPGTILYSSLFWTITSVGAKLGRPAITGPRSAPGVDTLNWKLLATKGEWTDTLLYSPFDAVTFNGQHYVCLDTVEGIAPNLDNRYWRGTVYRGEWISGTAYNAYDEVTYSNFNFVSPFSISGGNGLELVRVVPNPFDIRGRFFQFGDQSQYDQIAFYGLPPIAKLKIFTERGDLIWEKDHTSTTGDEVWDSKTSSGQIISSGIYILYVESPDGNSVFRKFVVIR